MDIFCSSLAHILSPARVTVPPPSAVDHPVRNSHTGWMIPAITLGTLHILLLVIWHSASTEDGYCCHGFGYMLRYPL